MKLVLFFALLLIPTVYAQETLNNGDVISMWQAGVSDTKIARMIELNNGNFSLTSNDLKQLVDNRVPDRVIQAMFQKMQFGREGTAATANNTAPAPAPAKPQSAAPAKPPAPIGVAGQPSVYYLRGNQWVEVITEPVMWTRSGAVNNIKKYASVGISRSPVRGELYAENSRTILANPPDVVVNVPDGSIIHDFLIVPLTVSKGKRGLTVGGNTKTDAAHGAVAFGVERITPTQYRITFPNTFGPGEYGAFNINTTGDGARDTPGRMYTFRIMPSM